MKRLVYGMIIVLAIFHQDFWWWDTAHPLVFGFMPIGLAYHAGISLAAGVLWALAVRYCWPAELDSVEEDVPASGSGRGGDR